MDANSRSLVARETIIIAGLLGVLYFISSRLDLFERFRELFNRFAYLQLDDLFVAVFLLTVILAVFSFRRGKKLGAELERQKVSQMSERKEAEETLRNSELRYKELTDLLPQTIYEIGPDGNFTFVNRAFYENSGYDETDILKGVAALDVIAPEDRERAGRTIERRIVGEDFGVVEYTAIRKDGSRFPLAVYSNAVLRDGRIVGVRGIAVNMTEQREAEERFRAIFNHAFQFTAILLPDGTVLDVNQTALEFAGVRVEDAVGIKMWDSECWAYSNEVREQLVKAVESAAKGSSVRFETENLAGSGEIATIDFSLKPVALGTNPVACLVAEGRDITTRRIAEKALIETKETLQSLIDASPMGISLLDADGKVLLWNPAAEEISGWKAEEVIGNIHPALAEKGAERFREHLAHLFEGKPGNGAYEAKTFRKDGSLLDISILTAPVRDSSGKIFGALGIFSDITKQKEAEQERKSLREHLSRAEKLEAIGTLAGGIAHDFNNLLGVIVGFTEIVLLDSLISENSRNNLQKVLQAALKAKELVKQILLFSRKGKPHERVPLDLVPVVKEIVAFLRSSIPSTIEMRFEAKADKAAVLATSTEIHQILVNLCTNAAHAMEEKGGRLSIVLSDSNASEAGSRKCPGSKSGRCLKIEVSDTGCGMDKPVLERIFDPYFTTKGFGKGTGLGLAVVHGIVEQLQGGIEVSSEPGKGASFNVFLPLADSGLEPIPPHAGSARLASSGTGRILIVDDEEFIATVESEMLGKLGYETVTKLSAHEALELFRSDPSRFDLVLTDFTMPRMTGEELARAILEIRPDMPIILATGYNQRISEVTAKELGIREFLMKPLTINDLGEAVRRALNQD